MHPWDAGQLATFLGWAEDNAQNYAVWRTRAMTGTRCGELSALRWRDVDLDAATVGIRRSAGMVRTAGEGANVVEGDTAAGSDTWPLTWGNSVSEGRLHQIANVLHRC
jgi:integrase